MADPIDDEGGDDEEATLADLLSETCDHLVTVNDGISMLVEGGLTTSLEDKIDVLVGSIGDLQDAIKKLPGEIASVLNNDRDARGI